MQIKNLKKAANRIKKAIKDKEKIILYGDADLDGVTSVIILADTIKNLGGLVAAFYFPDREAEGYGVTETALEILKDKSPALLIALDLGIGNVNEVKIAKKLGLEVIIIDHHEVPDKLPEAKIIVDPKQKGDKYPFKKLANAGLTFKLSEAILGKQFSQNLKQNFLELVALATIADMMPRQSENIDFINQGIRNIENSWRPGINVFFTLDHFKKESSFDQKISRIISILNVRDIENNMPASFILLTSSSATTAQSIIERLIEKNKEKRGRINDIVEEIEQNILNGKEKVIFAGSEKWDFALISAVASVLCRKNKKPTFIFKKIGEESQGTVRSPENVNSVSLMKQCKKHLITYGGHPQASGFRLKNKNLDKFKECLTKKFSK